MKDISHKQARAYWMAQTDGLLDNEQRAHLEAHLAGCAACRVETQSLSALEKRMRSGLHARWDTHDGPSVNVAAHVQTHSRRILMTNRIYQTLSSLTAVAAIVIFGVLINHAIALVRQQTASPASVTQPASPALIAFTSEQDGNAEIYVISPQGGSPINLTRHSARDTSPAWSPDGQTIAFFSDRQPGGIYAMRPDGSELRLLSAVPVFGRIQNTGAIHWSPDGARLLFATSAWDEAAVHQRDTLYMLDISNSTLREISSVPGFISKYAWSPDGVQFFFVVAADQSSYGQKIYTADALGGQPREVTRMLTADEIIGPRWLPDGQSITFAALQKSPPPAGGSEGDLLMWTIYQASPDGYSLAAGASYRSPVAAWWNGAVLLTGTTSDLAWTWARAGAKTTVWNPYRPCGDATDGGVGSSYQPSTAGRSRIASVFCQQQNTLWLYWINLTEPKLLPLNQPGLTATEPAAFVWSPDDRSALMTVAIPDGYALYLVDVIGAKADPELAPRLLFTSRYRIDGVCWRPVQ